MNCTLLPVYNLNLDTLVQFGYAYIVSDLSGDNLNIPTALDPSLTHYCGEAYLCAKVQDLKNTENIDPILSNNQLCVPIQLQCMKGESGTRGKPL